MKKEIPIRENAEIKWRNELVSGKWHLTLNEMRLLFIMASHIDKNADQFIRCKAPFYVKIPQTPDKH